MSKVKTIKDYETETESEKITIRKQHLDTQMKKYTTKINELSNEMVKRGGDARLNGEKLHICLENYQKMKSERDTIKQQLKQQQEINEKMKNTHKPIEKYNGFSNVVTNIEIEKEIDKYCNSKKTDMDEFKKMFEE